MSISLVTCVSSFFFVYLPDDSDVLAPVPNCKIKVSIYFGNRIIDLNFDKLISA